MTKLMGVPDNQYSPGVGWRIWGFATQAMKRQGWKLHVFIGSKAQAQQTLNLAMPILRAKDVNHKFWASDDPILNDEDENQGKWFAIYPSSNVEALEVASELEQALQAGGVTPLNSELTGEIKVDKGYVYSRYGPYGHDAMITSEGTTAQDARGIKAHPGWVENIWLQYKALTQPGSRIAVTLPSDFMAEFPAARSRRG
ncbi:hypothetical protein [Denitrobaculum tricleocarpae]|uniref:RamC N-terminal domain-containing protein n=1 Tax=Denitrobaculum tricleocarpae TaxID=2591009 RepID=A0A545U235_9PROT|nr:hypothetical protein [Denitrobaculum tricleocarpae]TQV83518.1 hypothetical protein FKG95_02705 [Denitrobaculum tricleocarpae]